MGNLRLWFACLFSCPPITAVYSGDTDHVERAKFRFADTAIAGTTLNTVL